MSNTQPKSVEEYVNEFEKTVKVNYGSLNHQVCNRGMKIDDILEHILPLFQEALTQNTERVRREDMKQILCREDIDGDVCDCCRANYDRIDDLI